MNLESFFLSALEADFGVVILTTNPDAFKRRFYAQRAEARAKGEDLYDRLSLVTSPDNPSNELWIVKGLNDASKD